MKKALKAIVCGIIGVLLIGIGVTASAQSECEYLIREDSGEYQLYRADGKTEELIESSEKLSELICTVQGAPVKFEDITVTEGIELADGKYEISGNLSVCDRAYIAVSSSAELILSEARVDFVNKDGSLSDGYIRVKGGRASINGCKILGGKAVPFTVDYSSTSYLTLNSTDVACELGPAIDCKMGTLVVINGKISTDRGYAISNDASLTVAGEADIKGETYDIYTSRPITLSFSESFFLGEMSVQYNTEFLKGNLYEIFRRASEESVSGIALYDKNGKRTEAEWFSTLSHTDERNFGGVYLPFTVRLYDKDRIIGERKLLSGEKIEELEGVEKTGYSFVGWYKDEAKTQEFNPNESVYGDMEIFAEYRLSPPGFSLSGMSFTYDTQIRTLSFDYLSHPLSDTGRYSFCWYRNSEKIENTSDRIELKNVGDSAEYYCEITFLHGTDSVRVKTPPVTVRIDKKLVQIPQAEPKEYTGNTIYSEITSTAYYTVEDRGGVNAGVYPVRITLKDSENYSFYGSDSAEVEVEFEIIKARNFFTDKPYGKNIYEGESPDISAHARFGDVHFVYSDKKDGEYLSEPPSSDGSYFAIARVLETENYTSLESEPIAFSVIAERVVSISVITPPKKTDYKAFEELELDGMKVNAVYNSGRSVPVGIELLEISYQSAESLRYLDNAVIISYLGSHTTVEINVEKCEYDLSGIAFADKCVVYNGEYHTVSYTGELPVGLDGIPLLAYVSEGGVEAGEYEVTLRFSSESRNYILPESISARLTVSPLEVDVRWSDTSFVYDGNPHAPSAFITDISGREIPLAVSGAVTNATSTAIAVAVPHTKSYKLKNPEKEFTVAKANYSFDSVVWSESGFVYDGSTKTVSVTGLPLGVSVIGYTDNSAKLAGSYTASALLSYDERNYNPPPILTQSWKIEKAEYDLTGFSFSSVKCTYDGMAHYPLLSGAMPVGADGIALQYEFSHGAVNVSDNPTVTVSFFTESENYNVPEPVLLSVEIEPMEIEIKWSYATAVYDGQMHIPEATNEHTLINVEGGEINAGEYTAIASPASSNYKILNPTYKYEIDKAKNSWVVEPKADSIYFGGRISPKAEAIAGNITYRVFSDYECTEIAEEPLPVGKYYVIITAEESENYLAIESYPIAIEVIEVVPVGIELMLSKTEHFAFEEVSDEWLSVILVHNDSSRVKIALSELEIEYQSSDGFRFGDTEFKVAYLGFSATGRVNIKRAKYDMSGVAWENTEAVYDGSLKSPALTGLPEGVSVIKYSGMSAEAGVYTVTAELSYDMNNYEEPTVSSVTFTVEKCILPIPKLNSAVYNGSMQFASAPTALYTVASEGHISAGKYTAEIAVSDPANYILENGEASASVDFEICPRTIGGVVGGITVYLWEKGEMPPHALLLSNVIGDDDLMLYYEIKEDKIYLHSANPNYFINASPGQVKYVNSLSPAASKRVGIISVSAVLLLLVLLVIIMKRRAILAFLVQLKEKYDKEHTQKAVTVAKAVAAAEKRPALLPDFESDTEESLLAIAIPEDELGPYEYIIDEENTEGENEIEINTEEKSIMSVDVDYADSLITDSLAKDLIRNEKQTVYTEGKRRNVINVDTISENFLSGDSVDVNSLKDKSLVSKDTGYIKVLARGSIDKPLTVRANAFSLSAVKMIALTGGEAVKVNTQRRETRRDVTEGDKEK